MQEQEPQGYGRQSECDEQDMTRLGARNITDEVERETGSAGPSYVGQGEDAGSEEAGVPATAGGWPVLTKDQMLRNQALDYASKSSDQDVLARARKYYDFLKGE